LAMLSFEIFGITNVNLLYSLGTDSTTIFPPN
jgi:hypothetical protein